MTTSLHEPSPDKPTRTASFAHLRFSSSDHQSRFVFPDCAVVVVRVGEEKRALLAAFFPSSPSSYEPLITDRPGPMLPVFSSLFAWASGYYGLLPNLPQTFFRLASLTQKTTPQPICATERKCSIVFNACTIYAHVLLLINPIAVAQNAEMAELSYRVYAAWLGRFRLLLHHQFLLL